MGMLVLVIDHLISLPSRDESPLGSTLYVAISSRLPPSIGETG